MPTSSIGFDIFARDRASGVFSKLGDNVSAVEKKFGKTGAAFDRVGQAAGKALAGGLTIAGVAAFKMGQQASDLAETQSKVNQIFGEKGAAALDRFAGSAATALGQSKQGALDAASTFGIFGKAAQLSGKDLVGFSTEMTTLASDLASFNNTSPEAAVEALGAALRGESEPLRAYGVMLDEATLKAEAMSLGLLKSTKNQAQIEAASVAVTAAQRNLNKVLDEHGKHSLKARQAEAALGTARDRLKKATEGTIPPLTQQQKVLAAQSAIMKQTKDAHGDFARTSDGLANKQRILKAQMANLGTEIGARVLPAMLKLTDIGLKGLDWIGENQRLVGILVVALGGFAAALWAISAAMRAWLLMQTAFAAAAKIATAVQWAWNAALAANPIGLVVIAIAGLVAGLVIAYKKSETFRRIVDRSFAVVKNAAMTTWNWIKKNWPYLLGIITGPIGLAVVLVIKHWGRIKDAARAAWEFVKNTTAAAWGWIRDKVMSGVGAVVDTVRSIPGRLRALGGMYLDAGRFLIGKIFEGLRAFGSLAGNVSRDLMNAIIGPINAGINYINDQIPDSIGVGPVSINLPNDPFPTIPSFARGVSNFSGGLAYVHGGEVLANLPRGTDVIPRHRVGTGRPAPVIVQLRIGAKVVEQILIDHVNAEGRPLQVRTLGPA